MFRHLESEVDKFFLFPQPKSEATSFCFSMSLFQFPRCKSTNYSLSQKRYFRLLKAPNQKIRRIQKPFYNFQKATRIDPKQWDFRNFFFQIIFTSLPFLQQKKNFLLLLKNCWWHQTSLFQTLEFLFSQIHQLICFYTKLNTHEIQNKFPPHIE